MKGGGWPFDTDVRNVPLFCPECGRKLVIYEWGVKDSPLYRLLRCDGVVGELPIIGRLHRALQFSNGSHFTYNLPPGKQQRGPERFDRFTGAPL